MMNNPQHHLNDMEQMLRELAAHELCCRKMDDAMAARLEARLDDRFRFLAGRSYACRCLAASAASLLLVCGSLALLQLREEPTPTAALTEEPAEQMPTIAAADWDKFCPPAPGREVVIRDGVEYHIETEEELPFTINDCYL